MDVSVIIPTCNKINRLQLTLKSLYRQLNQTINTEVLVINDGSDDCFDIEFHKLHMQYGFRYYKQEKKGRASARNKGIEYALAELLVFIDDDVILAPEFINTHIQIQRSTPAVLHGAIKNFIYSYTFRDPLAGVPYDTVSEEKSTYMEYLKKKCQLLVDDNSYDSLLAQSKYLKLEKRIQSVFREKNYDKAWIAFTGGNLSCPKKWIEEVNGFDENFGLQWGCEDLELGYRLNKMNRHFAYNYEASCCHMDHRKENARIEHGNSINYFFDKYKDDMIYELDKYLFG